MANQRKSPSGASGSFLVCGVSTPKACRKAEGGCDFFREAGRVPHPSLIWNRGTSGWSPEPQRARTPRGRRHPLRHWGWGGGRGFPRALYSPQEDAKFLSPHSHPSGNGPGPGADRTTIHKCLRSLDKAPGISGEISSEICLGPANLPHPHLPGSVVMTTPCGGVDLQRELWELKPCLPEHL